jgi:hypothetical protein
LQQLETDRIGPSNDTSAGARYNTEGKRKRKKKKKSPALWWKEVSEAVQVLLRYAVGSIPDIFLKIATASAFPGP